MRGRNLILRAGTSRVPRLLVPTALVTHRSFAGLPGGGGMRGKWEPEPSEEDVLALYTVDMTELAREHKVDPVIGREAEIRRTMTILSRRTKSNPLLVGDPGVGKTAIVEGIAHRIVDGDVPASMKKKKILSLDVGSLMSGTKYRGEFEERFKKILAAIKADPEVILFVDEAHVLVGMGGSEGSQDAANLLKPALARGEVHCVAATTTAEYRKYIESDGALARRFLTVQVDEPTGPAALAIMRGLRERYETHHGVNVHDSALVSAVKLSSRYITDRRLPDSAIDLLDESMAQLRLEQESQPEAVEKLYREVMMLKIEEKALSKETDTMSATRLKELQETLHLKEEELDRLQSKWRNERSHLDGLKRVKLDLANARRELDDAQRKGDLGRASELKYGIIPTLEAKDKATESIEMLSDSVGPELIEKVVSRKTGVAMERLSMNERQRLIDLEDSLNAKVVGQPEAVAAVSSCMRVARAGLQNANRPLGVFCFVGPTGVGKTLLSRELAAAMFDSEKNLIQLDMQDYAQPFAVSKMVGAPPGYVGYDQGGVLTNAVQNSPYSVILLDEFEKADPSVGNTLLSVFDEGSLTDARGTRINFRNTVIILTSNLGAHHLADLPADAPADAARAHVMAEVRKYFSPELLNRIDEVVLFRRLPLELMEPIVRNEVHRVEQSLHDSHPEMHLNVSEKAVKWLADTSYDPAYGARPVRRTVQRSLLGPLARLLVEREPTSMSVTADIGLPDSSELSVKFD